MKSIPYLDSKLHSELAHAQHSTIPSSIHYGHPENIETARILLQQELENLVNYHPKKIHTHSNLPLVTPTPPQMTQKAEKYSLKSSKERF
jgi:hypothetical protein